MWNHQILESFKWGFVFVYADSAYNYIPAKNLLLLL